MPTARTRILEYIRAYSAAKGYAPSFREIMEGASVGSLSTVHRQLSRLERDGVIRRSGRRARSIVLLADSHPK